MRHQAVLRLIVLVLLVGGGIRPTDAAAQDGTPAPGDGLILTRVLDRDDDPIAALVVVSPDGGERRTIDLPDSELVIPTPRRAQALVKTYDGTIYLIDAERGTAEPLDIPTETVEDLLFTLRAPFIRTGGSERWAVLGDARQSTALLLDLTTGDVTDLAPSVAGGNGGVFISSVDLSPDESHLLVWSGPDLWLVPTDDPGAARRLGEDAYGGSFSPDGARLVYSRAAGNQATEVVVASVDGGGEEVVAEGEGFLRATFAPDGDGFVLYEAGRVSLLDAVSERRREVVDLQGEASRVIPGLDGTRVLIGAQGPTDTPLRWFLLDLERAESRSLDDLRGFDVLLDAADGRRWLALADNRPFDVGGAANVRVVDLETGEVGGPIALVAKGTDSAFYEVPADISADGRYRLLPIDRESGGRMDLRLLDAAANTARPIVEDVTRATGAFDPTGSRVAISTLTHLDGGTTETSLFVLDRESGDETPLGEGLGAIWLRG